MLSLHVPKVSDEDSAQLSERDLSKLARLQSRADSYKARKNEQGQRIVEGLVGALELTSASRVAIRQLDMGNLRTPPKPLAPAGSEVRILTAAFKGKATVEPLPLHRATYTGQFPYHPVLDQIGSDREVIDTPMFRQLPETTLNENTIMNAVPRDSDGISVIVGNFAGATIDGLDLPNDPAKIAGAAFALTGVEGDQLVWEQVAAPVSLR